ncbi:uncharacterized protein LOC118477131 [Aplysia californica]|uniref:Uncharacterized protein LOC118477131 n=1 Tax=Aplysia californica TaxID=6500 RepID=A0ABM1VYQ0_APLCA|nr:uncharacterized protein LOC118477131 [Aplysia californica]
MISALIYGCPFCGVRFSSPRTLQGHLSYYCSKKTSDLIVNPGAKDRDKGNNHGKQTIEVMKIKQEPGSSFEKERMPLKRRAEDAQPNTEFSEDTYSSSPSKMGRPGEVFRCKFCSYKADKLSSLNRHMRMHNNERTKAPSSLSTSLSSSSSSLHSVEAASEAVSAAVVVGGANSNALKSPSPETFCKECRIQFSSFHTYKCHKEHYCAQRRKKSMTDSSSAFAAMFQSPFTFSDASQVGIPSALQMAALNQGGLILPGTPPLLQATVDPTSVSGAATVILTTPVLTANGMANMAISVPTVLMPQMMPSHIQEGSAGGGVNTLGNARIKTSPGRHTPQGRGATSSPLPSPRGKRTPTSSATHFLSPPTPQSTSSRQDYTRTLEELHRGKTFAATPSSGTDQHSDGGGDDDVDHPLDLTVTKKEPVSDASQDDQKSANFFQPDKDGALDARRVIRTSSSSSLSDTAMSHDSYEKDLKNDSMKMSSSPLRSTQCESTSSSSSSQRHTRSDSPHASASHAPTAILPHPSVLVPNTAFLAAHGATPLALSPPGKLAASMGTLPSPSAPNNISKCSDCNIVFYKHDNYLIHKKHYCSGKRRGSIPSEPPHLLSLSSDHHLILDDKPSLSQRSSPSRHGSEVPSSSRESPKAPKQEMSPPAAPKPGGDMTYKYFCVPCRIKFSNASILEAHKEYYCPAGKDSEQSVILQSANSSEQVALSSPSDEVDDGPPDSPQEEFTCARCNSIFASARLLRLHMCEGGFPCPHCDHVAITENRLAEHMKVHAPTRAYRCTICGYRGNTARGMRMHGKTHIDEGVEFTDENMLEYHEPALVPIIQSSVATGCTDTELLRLKNEPYKRRRSRKAYEKFDYPLPKVDVPQTCPLCGQNFANADFLASHFKVHEIAASQYVAGLMKCIHCDYVGKSAEDLRAHFEANHTGQLRSRMQRESRSPVRPGLDRRTTSGIDHRRDQRAQDELDDDHDSSHEQDRIMVVRDPNSPFDEKPLFSTSEEGEEFDRASSARNMEDSNDSSHLRVVVKQEPMDPIDGEEAQQIPKVDHFLHPVRAKLRSESTSEDGNDNHHSNELSMSPSSPLTRGSVDDNNRHRMTSPQRFVPGQEQLPEGTDTVSHDVPRVKPEPVSDSDESRLTPGIEVRFAHNSQNQLSRPESETGGDIPPDSPDSGNTVKASSTWQRDSARRPRAHPRGESVSGDESIDQSTAPETFVIKSERDSPLPDHGTPNPNFLMGSPSQPHLRQSPTSPAHAITTSSSPPLSLTSSSRTSPVAASSSSSFSAASLGTSGPSISIKQSTSPPAPTSLPSMAAFPNPAVFPPYHPSLLSTPAATFPYAAASSLPYFFLPSHPHRPHSGASPSTPFPPLLRDERPGTRYCQNCDISFSKQATYLAHKKHYCEGRPRGGDTQSSAKA